MKTTPKPGANDEGPARKAHPKDPNFAQSRDIHEDRGERQAKTVRPNQSVPRASPRRTGGAVRGR